MSEPIQAYPLQWPPGWARKQPHQRSAAKFSRGNSGWQEGRYVGKTPLNVMDSIQRLVDTLGRMEIQRDDVVISTDIPTRLDGLPRANRNASDPGAAVYWRKGKDTRCIAIDRYDRTADNLAAIAATGRVPHFYATNERALEDIREQAALQAARPV